MAAAGSMVSALERRVAELTGDRIVEIEGVLVPIKRVQRRECIRPSCGTLLSSYNKAELCNACQRLPTEQLREIGLCNNCGQRPRQDGYLSCHRCRRLHPKPAGRPCH